MRPCQGRDRGFESRHPRHTDHRYTSVVFVFCSSRSTRIHLCSISATHRAGFVGAVLLLPLIGTLLQAGFTWSLSDFAIAAVILWLLASISSWLRSTIPTARGRWFALLGVVLVGALCWVELAVGVFGSPLAGS